MHRVIAKCRQTTTDLLLKEMNGVLGIEVANAIIIIDNFTMQYTCGKQ